MKNFLRKLTGTLLIVAAVIGMLLCLAGLALLWLYRPAITASFTANVALARSTLETTAAGLTIADQSLQGSIDSIGALQVTVQTTADTIEASTPLVNTMTTLTSKDLPDTYVSTQAALLAAQESAKIIDQVLQTLNSLPFVSPNLYNPPVPLNVALAQISISMQNIPELIGHHASQLEYCQPEPDGNSSQHHSDGGRYQQHSNQPGGSQGSGRAVPERGQRPAGPRAISRAAPAHLDQRRLSTGYHFPAMGWDRANRPVLAGLVLVPGGKILISW